MGALRSMSNFLGYSEPTEEAYEDDFEVAESDYAVQEQDELADNDFQDYAASVPEPVVPADLRRIVTVHPSTYNEARVIGESFRDGVPVIINLTGMSESDARRMVDFSAGLVFGLHGAIERVTPRVFLLTPASVEIDGGEAVEGRDRFFNQG
ncbi:cell division protein SepF [Actinomyces sp. 2119]|uniref:Cell division protein SepF n=1 Tax=Actinomyces lilanjuaniae TaxID=2321394 RepID=A0ABM6Z389_9ACTO|nr:MULTISPECIES: cell division protein SepF [Actinomyces]AYD89596.1 cell division protein SepF [Actinomyces lilanjuaniae]RJF43035.1 cell division protein SepF [Actinomyces sp. 2119]